MRLNRQLGALVLVLVVAAGTGMTLWSAPLSRVIFSTTNLVPPYHPDFLYGNFTVTEVETGIKNPIVQFSLDLDKNQEYNDCIITFCLLNFSLEQLQQVSNISTLWNIEQSVGGVGSGDGYIPPIEFQLPNTPCSYVWVLWIEVDSIPSTWTIDVSIVLLFSII